MAGVPDEAVLGGSRRSGAGPGTARRRRGCWRSGPGGCSGRAPARRAFPGPAAASCSSRERVQIRGRCDRAAAVRSCRSSLQSGRRPVAASARSASGSRLTDSAIAFQNRTEPAPPAGRRPGPAVPERRCGLAAQALGPAPALRDAQEAGIRQLTAGRVLAARACRSARRCPRRRAGRR